MEQETCIPIFLQFSAGLSKIDNDGVGEYESTLKRREQSLWTEDSEGEFLSKESVVRNKNINLDNILINLESVFMHDFMGDCYHNKSTTTIDMSSTYRRKRDLFDRRRKMAMEAGDNELLELLENNQNYMLDELNLELSKAIDKLWVEMQKDGNDFMLVSPDMASLLRVNGQFVTAKQDLMNMTSIVVEGTIKNITVFTNMMVTEENKWFVFMGNSKYTQMQVSVSGDIFVVKSRSNLKFNTCKAVKIVGGDVKKSLTMFSPALNFDIEPAGNERGDLLRDVIQGMSFKRVPISQL